MISSILNSTNNQTRSNVYVFDTYPIFHAVKQMLLERYVIHNAFDRRLPGVIEQHIRQLREVVQDICKQVIIDSTGRISIIPKLSLIPILNSLDMNALLRTEITIQEIAEHLEGIAVTDFVNEVIALFGEIDSSNHVIKTLVIEGSNVICEVVPLQNCVSESTLRNFGHGQRTL